MICGNCGYVIEEGHRFCPNCGQKVSDASDTHEDIKAELATEDLAPSYAEPQKQELPESQDTYGSADSEEKTDGEPTWMETFTRIGIPAQGVALALYGAMAGVMYSKMRTYDITSVHNGGGSVHLFYLLTVWLGIALIALLIVKGKKYEGGIRIQKMAVPVIVTVMAWLNSQANTVYVQTEGGSLLGFGRYIFRALLSGSDPIDSFVYGKFTVYRYALVIIVGIAAAAFALLRGRSETGDTSAAGMSKAAAASPSDVTAAGISKTAASLSDITEAGVSTAAATSAKVGSKFSKVNKGILIAGVAVVCIVLGVVIYFTSFAPEKYDISTYTGKPHFYGYNGSGEVEGPMIIFDKINYEDEKAYDLDAVLNTVTFEVTPAEGLSNGDTVIVTATYDKDLAKKCRIKLDNFSKEYTVEGLDERLSAESLNAETVSMLRDKGKNSIASSLTFYDKISVEPVATYLQTADYPDTYGGYDDRLYFIYKASWTYSSLDEEPETETQYVVTSTNSIVSAESLKEAEVYNDYYYDTYEEAVNNVMETNGYGYKIEKIEG